MLIDSPHGAVRASALWLAAIACLFACQQTPEPRLETEPNGPEFGLHLEPPLDASILIDGASSQVMRYRGRESETHAWSRGELSSALPYMEVGQGSGDLVSTTTFGDTQLHIEWYCPPGGEGDARSNSGLIFHQIYEVQIFGTPKEAAPRIGGAGAIYGVSAPSENASTGPGTWQAYDVFFRAPRFVDGVKTENAQITLYWNGRLVQDRVEVPGSTGAADLPESPTGKLVLQDYRTQAEGAVRFRNGWVREWPTNDWKAGEWTRPLAQPGGWEPRGGQAEFRNVADVLRGETRPNTPNTFYTSLDTYADFELTYEARVHPSLNSGVQIRSEVLGGIENRDGGLKGYQIEIDPSTRAWTAGLYEERGRAWLAPLTTRPEARFAFKQGEWNRFRVLARGQRIQSWINGEIAVDTLDAERASGHIGFQVHGVGKREEPLKVEWRNVRLRPWSR